MEILSDVCPLQVFKNMFHPSGYFARFCKTTVYCEKYTHPSFSLLSAAIIPDRYLHNPLRWMPGEPYRWRKFTWIICKTTSLKDANGFFHIYPCMEGRGIERQTKKPKTITANRKINRTTTIFRFTAKIRDEKGELKGHFSLARSLQEPTEHSQSIKKYFILFYFDFLR